MNPLFSTATLNPLPHLILSLYSRMLKLEGGTFKQEDRRKVFFQKASYSFLRPGSCNVLIKVGNYDKSIEDRHWLFLLRNISINSL